MPLVTGQMLSNYRLVEIIGEGGMGVVYKGLDIKLEREVALKVLRPEMASDPERLMRFEREAKAVAALNHPNIASIYQIDEVDGVTFIAMELVEGQTLRHRTSQSKPLPVDLLLETAIQIVDALDAAHEKGIIHRDLKPANILLDTRGRAKVLDFGLAKLTFGDDDPDAERSQLETVTDRDLTTPGSTMGTIAYMSPEQVRGEDLDTRSDLFSYGAVLFEMATAASAFGGNTTGLVFDAILNYDPTPPGQLNPGIPLRLEEIILKTLEKDRKDRYQTAADIRDDLVQLRREYESGKSLVTAGAVTRSAVDEDLQPQVEAATQRNASVRKRRFVFSAVALAVILAGASYLLLQVLSGGPAPLVSGGPIDSIAVLPFEYSGGAEGDYLGDGITESLINSLSKLPNLRIVPRSLVFNYKGNPIDPGRVGREFGVRAVVTGRVTQRGDTLVVGAELIDVASVAQIWGEQYSRTMTDIFAVQEEIAREISRNLRIQLTPADELRMARRYTENTEAYQLYIKSLNQMRLGTRTGYERALEYANGAIIKDLQQRGTTAEGETEEPGFALAYAALARIYTLQALSGFVRPKEVHEKAKSAALFALEMDDTLGNAHGALAFVKFFYEWDWVTAETEFRRALQLAPNDDETHKDYALYLMAMGRQDEALAEMQQAVDLDPLEDENTVLLAEQLFYARRYDEALDAIRKTQELSPDSPQARLVSAYIHAVRGEYQEAIDNYLDYLFDTEAAESPLSPTRTWFYAITGKHDEAREIIAQATPGTISPTQMAWIHAALGENDLAFAWLDKAFEQRAINLLWIKVQPWFDPLRDDARFGDLLQRMNLPD